MRSHLARQRAATSAVLAASIAVLAACGAKAGPQAASSAEPSPAPESTTKPVRPTYATGTILISDGTNVVTVGNTKVTFPTTVKDAVWSPDGSRIAFVDGEGRVATARPDGTSIVVTKPGQGSAGIERPAWFVSSIIYTGRIGSRSSILRVNASGSSPEMAPVSSDPFDPGAGWPSGNIGQPSAVVDRTDFDGFRGHVAYERTGAKGEEVWVLDYNQREPYSAKVADGSEPAVSPDGKKVAYVGRDGQIQVASLTTESHKPVTKVTFGAASPSRLVWTADGARIAYSTPHGVESVAAVPVSAKSNPAKQITTTPASVSYLIGRANRAEQIGGDPVAAAIRATQVRWPSPANGSEAAGTVVLASAAQPDVALLAAQFAGSQYGPLLLTSGATLDPAVRDEIKRLLGKPEPAGPASVTLIGDYPAAIETAIRALGYAPKHITGTPSDLSAIAATQLSSAAYAETVLVADTTDLQAVAAAVADQRGPVILSENGKLSATAVSYLRAATKAKVLTIGDRATAAVPRMTGVTVTKVGEWSSDSVKFAQHFMLCPQVAVVVDGGAQYLPVAASLAISTGAPLLYTGDSPAAYLDSTSGTTDVAYVVGSVPEGLIQTLSSAIS